MFASELYRNNEKIIRLSLLKIVVGILLSCLGSMSVCAATKMKVHQFSWVPSSMEVGGTTTFYWNIENAVSCFGNNKSRSSSGNNGRHTITAPRNSTTRWSCTDKEGNTINLSAPLYVYPTPTPPGKASPLSSPTNFYQPVNTNVSLSWPSVSGASNYKIYENGSRIYYGAGRSTSRNHSQYGRRLYTVQACNSDGCGGQSAQIPIVYYTAPGPVQNLKASPTSTKAGNTSSITWEGAGGSVPGVIYKVFVNNTFKKQTTSKNYILTTKAGSNTVKVNACNPNNVGCGSSQSVSVTGTVTPPGKSSPLSSPTSLYQPVNTNVSLSWPSVAGATSYKLLEDGSQIYSGAGRTFTRNHNQYGRRIYTIKACNSGGCGEESSGMPVVYYTAPGPVQNLKSSADSVEEGSSTQITWDAAGGSVPGSTYVVNINGVNQQPTTQLSHPLTVIFGENIISVVACNPKNVGCGSSRTVNLTGIAPRLGEVLPLSSPTDFYQPVDTHVALEWPSVAGATSYKLLEDGSQIYSGAGRTFTRNHNQYGRRVYTIQACNSGGCGEESSGIPVVYYTAPGPVQNLKSSTDSVEEGSSTQITWDAAGGSVPGSTYVVNINGVNQQPTTQLSHPLTVIFGENIISVVACNPKNVGCGSSRTVNLTGIAPRLGEVLPLSSPTDFYQPVDTPVALEWPSVAGATSYKLLEDGSQIYSGAGRTFTRNHNQYGRRIYTIQACNSGGCGEESSGIPVVYYTAPGPVQNLKSSADSVEEGSSTQITWDAAGGSVPGSTYVVNINGVNQQPTTQLSHPLTVIYGENIISVVACNPKNVGCGSGTSIKVTGTLIAPKTPTSFRLACELADETNEGSLCTTPPTGEVTLSWKAPADKGVAQYQVMGELAYILEQRHFTPDEDGYFRLTRPALTEGREYCYKVRAIFDDGSKGDFTDKLCKVIGELAFNEPSNVSVEKIASQEFNISWSPVAGASKYLLEQQVSHAQWQAVQYNSATHKNQQYNTDQQAVFNELGHMGYRVSACNNNNICGNYNRVYYQEVDDSEFVQTSPTSHKTPACLRVPQQVNAGEAIQVSWCPPEFSGVQSYEVIGELKSIIVSGAPSSFATDKQGLLTILRPPLPAGREYCYKIRAIYANGEAGSDIEKQCVTVGAIAFEAPTELVSQQSEENYFDYNIGWTEVSGAHHYVLEKVRLSGRNLPVNEWQQVSCNTQAISINNLGYIGCSVAMITDDNITSSNKAGFRVSACDASNVCGNYKRYYFEVLAEPTVYQQDENNLYIQIGNKRFHLSLVNESWEIFTDVSQIDWDLLTLTESDFTLEFGEFGGDDIEDFRLLDNDDANDIIVFQGNGNQEYTAYMDSVNGITDSLPTELERPETTDIVGKLSSSATISGGSVNYSVPIVVPPGRQGMQPILSLQYNSTRGNGLLGVGWSISGQSTITRCSANWTEDNKIDRVDLQDNDLLCINGQKLVLVYGNYGEIDSEYRTLHDSFSKITLLGDAYSTTSSYFEVINKSGQVSYYGESANSILTPDNTTIPLTWSISKVYDNAETKNNMLFTYISSDGEQTLTDIYYTGQDDTTGNRRVQFSYEDRDDVSFGYLAGGSVKTTQRLSSITTYVGSTKVFDYDLVYELSNSPITELTRLASIEQCGFENTTEKCLPKKEFTYSGDTHSFDEVESTNVVFNSSFPWSMENQILGDFNNDGVTDFARGDQLHLMSFDENQYVIDSVLMLPFISAGITEDPRELAKLGQLDFNNDGKIDILGINDSGNLSVAMLNDAQNGFEEQDLGIGLTCAALKTYSRLYNYDTSVNVSLKYRNACLAEPVSDGMGGYYLFHRSVLSDLYLSRIHPECTDSLCSTQLIPGIDKTAPAVYPKYHAAPSDYQFFDFDGDGDPDIVRIEEVSAEVNADIEFVWYRNDQSGNGTSITNTFVKITETLPVVTNTYGLAAGGNHWLDANGDGLKDLLVHSGNWYLFINEGGTLSTPIDTGIDKFERSNVCFMNCNSSGPEHTTHPSIKIIDFNSDGLQDFMFLDRNSSDGANNNNPNQRDCFSDRERAYCKEGSGSESPSINDFSISPLAFGRYSVYLSSIGSNGSVSFTKQETDIQGSMNYLYPVDMNNDGSMDYIGAIWQDDHTTTDSTSHSQETYFYLGKTDSNGLAPDLLTLAQDDSTIHSFGQKDEFEYQAFSQHKQLIENSAAVDNSDLAGKYYYRIPSTQMVAVQHSFKNNNAGTNTLDYVYGDPIYHQAGLGFLGFESISEVNNTQGTTGTATYLMDYPLNGKMDQFTLVETADDTVLKNQTNIWCDITTTACDSADSGVYFTHLESSLANYFDPEGNAIKTEQVTNNSFDDYGNITEKTTVISDITTTHTTVLDNVYNIPDEVYWWVDQLDYSQVTNSVIYTTDQGIVTGTNGDKVQRRSVTWKDNNARQLATETLTASDTELTAVSTYNTYDDYGNLTKMTRSGTSIENTDYTDVQADQILENSYANSSGYYVNWQKNGLWLSNTVTQTWDNRFGKMLTKTDINARTVTNHYDWFGRLNQIESSSAPTLDMVYQWCSDCASNNIYSLTTVQDGTPTVVESFDRFSNILQKTVSSFSNNIIEEQQTIESFAYDDLGRLTTHTLPHFSDGTTSTETLGAYDVLNRATTKTVNNLPQSYTTTYTFSGLETSIEVDAGSDGTITMARTYNALNQLISSTDANSNSTYFHYDANGNAIFIMDVLENVISAKYDGFNNKQWLDDPNFGRRDFRYNGLGQLRWQEDANSDEISFDYDGLGRQTKRYVNDSTHATWTYDTRKKGVLSTLSGITVNKNYYYDNQVRVTKKSSEIHNQLTTRTFDIEYAYDSYYGRIKGIGYPSGELLERQYDQYGYQTDEINPNNGRVYRSVKHLSLHGKVSQQQMGNGLNNMVQFTPSGEMTRVCVTSALTCVNSIDEIYYQRYDNFGNLKTANNVVNEITETYDYDNLHRIESATRTAGGILVPEFLPTATTSYDYDAAGNLLLKGDYASVYDYIGTSTSTGGPNAVKSVTKLNGNQVNFDYDSNGNLTSGDGLSITYNHFNKPINIIRNAMTLAFTYDGDEQRALQVATHADKTVTTYYVDKLFEQVETIISGSASVEQRDYIGSYGVISHTDSGRSLRYLHRDRLGSVSMISNGDQHVDDVNAVEQLVLERKGYDAFGKPRDLYWGDGLAGILASKVTNRGFTDHEHLDEVQLIHMNGRAYDYNLGRFLSVDPFIQFPEGSQSINPYSYLMNNPLAGTDPSGYKRTWNPVGGWAGPSNGNWGRRLSSQGNDVKIKVDVGKIDIKNVDSIDINNSSGAVMITLKEQMSTNVSDNFISNHVNHFTEKVNPEDSSEPLLVATGLPDELRDSLVKFGATDIGNKVYQQFIKDGATATFTEVTTATDPDLQVAWRVGFNGNPNEIHYTRNISAWKAAPYTKRSGDEIQSSTLGSLIAHEFGHTRSGLAAIGIRQNTFKLSVDEPRASALFENSYRAKYNMPIKRTYRKENDVLNFRSGN